VIRPAFLASSEAERIVPPTGTTAQLTTLAAAAMAFLCVFALALLYTTGRVADRWSGELAQSATVRISAPADQMEAQVTAVLAILAQTPGVADARALSDEEQQALLTPWFGPDLPLETLPIPQLVELTRDARGLTQRVCACACARKSRARSSTITHAGARLSSTPPNGCGCSDGCLLR